MRSRRPKIIAYCGIILGTMIFLQGCDTQKEATVTKQETVDAKEKPSESEKEKIKNEAEKEKLLADIRNLAAGSIVEEDQINRKWLENYFTADKINDDIFQAISGKTYTENDNIGREDLRYVKVLHYNYGHQIQVGELIVNAKIAEDCQNIFRELFEKEYEIASMHLLEKYWTGDGVTTDTESIEHNNTSAFNYRVVPGTSHLSNHAGGYAIDLNPLQNPYVTYNSDGSIGTYYKDMEKYLDRDSGAEHMITHEDPAYKIFTKYGFTWGGDWYSSKDYQHFEKTVE